MSMVEFEAANVTAPLKNNTGMTCIAVLMATPASQTVDFSTLFGDWNNGSYYTIAADGAKVYIAFGATPGTIDETATGTGATVAYPIPDGTSLPARLLSGRGVSTGFATMLSYQHLHYKAAATCYLRIYRSSVPANGDAGFFKASGALGA